MAFPPSSADFTDWQAVNRWLEDEKWRQEVERQVPWWMRLAPFGFINVGIQGMLIWVTDPTVINVGLYVLGAVALGLWAAGHYRRHRYRRWFALQRAVGVEL